VAAAGFAIAAPYDSRDGAFEEARVDEEWRLCELFWEVVGEQQEEDRRQEAPRPRLPYPNQPRSSLGTFHSPDDKCRMRHMLQLYMKEEIGTGELREALRRRRLYLYQRHEISGAREGRWSLCMAFCWVLQHWRQGQEVSKYDALEDAIYGAMEIEGAERSMKNEDAECSMHDNNWVRRGAGGGWKNTGVLGPVKRWWSQVWGPWRRAAVNGVLRRFVWAALRHEGEASEVHLRSELEEAKVAVCPFCKLLLPVVPVTLTTLIAKIWTNRLVKQRSARLQQPSEVIDDSLWGLFSGSGARRLRCIPGAN
jgi:hypothetical protein